MQRELRTGLTDLDFEPYHEIIKKDGFKFDLEPRQMKKVATSLGLHHFETPQHEQSLIFNNQIMLKKSRYAVRPLLLLGIIFCNHENE